MMSSADTQLPVPTLKGEHRVILRVLAVLRRLVDRSAQGLGLERESLARCVEFFRLFADACHHAKEEDLLFPVLESRGIPREDGPIGVMLYEHQLARKFTREMGEALAAFDQGQADAESRFRDRASEYLSLLEGHIFKEDNILFNMGDRVMTDEDQQSLALGFCKAGCKAFEGRTREQLELLADELEAQWPGGSSAKHLA